MLAFGVPFFRRKCSERPSRARLRSGIEVNGEVGAHGRSSAMCLLPIDTRVSMGEGETISRECNETQWAAARNGSGMHENRVVWAWRIMCLHVIIAI